jgi:PAS domain S-box-containing protein
MNYHLLLSAEGQITFYNNPFQAWSGYPLNELSGKQLQNYLPPKYAKLVNEFLKEPYFQDSLHIPRIPFFGKENIKWAELTLSYMSDAGKTLVIASLQDVNEHALNEIIKTSKSHASFFAGHPFGVLHLNTQGQLTNINLQVQTDSGYNLGALQELPLLSLVLPKYKRKVVREYIKATRIGKSSTFDIQIFTSSLRPLHVNFTIVPVVYHGQTIEVYFVVKNIAERIILQQNLKKLSLVADKTTNGVMVLNANFEIELINDGFTLMSGFTRDDAIGRGLSSVLRMADEGMPKTELAKQDLSNGTPMELELLCTKKDGTNYWNLLKLTPIMSEQGHMEMCIIIHTDITDKKKAEMELRMLADDLYRQNKELHQFAYIVSHNMRSPVANIVGLANLLEVFKDDPETQTQTLKELTKSVNNLDTVIKDLSYILTINNASKELFKEPVNFQDLLQQVLIDLQPQIFATDANVHLPAKVLILRTNRAYLHSIFYNLISNALKYRSHQIPFIKIDYYLTDEHTVIYVADNGKGIDLNKHEQDLFKPYKRFDFKVEGKGLGLFLVKSHIEALGGHLNVKSELKKGSTFYIKVPFM